MSRRSWDKYAAYKGRRVDELETKERFLIVCEGKKTEPNYFKGFRVPKDVVIDIKPDAGTHISVVETAIQIKSTSSDPYDQIWCVFDRDKDAKKPNDLETFNNAIQLARSEEIKVAYSNDAFELWYLLHFDYHDTAISRHDYTRKLNKLLKGGYKKNDRSVYTKLEDKLAVAIKNAQNLMSTYEKENVENRDPSTTVHLLVEQLQRFSQ